MIVHDRLISSVFIIQYSLFTAVAAPRPALEEPGRARQSARPNQLPWLHPSPSPLSVSPFPRRPRPGPAAAPLCSVINNDRTSLRQRHANWPPPGSCSVSGLLIGGRAVPGGRYGRTVSRPNSLPHRPDSPFARLGCWGAVCSALCVLRAVGRRARVAG